MNIQYLMFKFILKIKYLLQKGKQKLHSSKKIKMWNNYYEFESDCQMYIKKELFNKKNH